MVNRILLSLILFSVPCFGVCTSTANGNWSAGATWSGCAGSGGIPATSDSPVIATSVTLDSSQSVVAVSIAGANAQLITNASGPYTLTMTTSSIDALQIAQGCTAIGSGCVSAYALDTSAGSAGKEVTFSCPSATGNSCVAKEWISPYTGANINFIHAKIASVATGGNGALYFSDNSSSGTLNVNYAKISGGPIGIYDYKGANLSVQNYTWSGGSGGYQGAALIVGGAPSTCTLANITALDPVGNIYTIFSQSNFDPCNPTGIVGSADTAGSYSVTVLKGTQGFPPAAAAQTISYVIGKSYQSTSNSVGYSSVSGSATYAISVTHIAGENLFHCAEPQSYNATSYTVCQQSSAVAGAQGGIIGGGLTSFSSAHDSVVLSSNAGNIGIFSYGSGGVGSGSLVNETVIMANPDGGTSAGLQLGESGTGNNVASGNINDSIVINGSNGIFSGNSANVFTTGACTAVAGVCNNDVYGTTANAYVANGTGMGSSPYGGMTVNPYFYSEAHRTYARCDEYLGSLGSGAGTAEHLFTMLGNQWNGTNGAYTPQSVWACMSAPLITQNPALNKASRSGSFIGAYPVTSLAGAVAP